MITFHVWLHGVKLPLRAAVHNVTGLDTFLLRAEDLQNTQADDTAEIMASGDTLY